MQAVLKVLISTYWNVNCDKTGEKHLIGVVLISTYWKVHNDWSDNYSNYYMSFNLNLLECKSVNCSGI